MTKRTKRGGIIPTQLLINSGQLIRPAKLTPKQVERLNASTAAYYAELALVKPLFWPKPEEYEGMTDAKAQALGFTGKSSNPIDGLDQLGLGELFGLDQDAMSNLGFSVANKSKKPKKQPLPDPKATAKLIKALLATLSPAQLTGVLRVATQNGHFLTDDKVGFFADCYKAIFEYFNCFLFTEISPDGAKALAKLTGFEYFVSNDNTRGGQAVAILFDPKRLDPTGKAVTIEAVADVQGVNDLRPMLWAPFKDRSNNKAQNYGVNHLKSMRGGPQTTGVVRKQQCEAIVRELPKGWKGGMGGDWNCRMNDGWSRIDLKPLHDAGFVLVGEKMNKLPTHIMGGWLDGFFFSPDMNVTTQDILQWFATTKRDFTDHALVGVSVD